MPKRLLLKSNTILHAVDFFCGAGGVTCGFNKAGIKVLAGIDVDPSCKETYEKNNRGSKFIEADISRYDPKTLAKDVGVERNDDKLIFVGCSPCQYYSTIQTSKKSSAKSRLLLEDFRTFVDYFRPGYVFIENVPGLDTKIGSPLQSFKLFLQTNGYVFDEGIVNARYYNVPQNRKRYVLVATRVMDKVQVPKPRANSRMTVRNFIAPEKGFPRIPAGHVDNSRKQHISAKLEAINLKRIKRTPKNGGTRLEWKNDRKLQLSCYKGKDTMFPDVYGRMYWDQPSPTITTKFFSLSNGRFGHPEQNRAISLREGATLQSFPRGYRFYSQSIEAVARMIGNAVPPRMAEKIGDALVRNSSLYPIPLKRKKRR